MSADEENTSRKIPLELKDRPILHRSLTAEPIVTYYIAAASCIQTTVFFDFGQVELIVTNCTTGEVWYDSFDSALLPQTLLAISGTQGLYEIVYLTDEGDVYQGCFIL